jgi:hypothetical protein
MDEAEGTPAASMGRGALLEKNCSCLGGVIPQRRRKPYRLDLAVLALELEYRSEERQKELTFRLPVKACSAAAMMRDRRTVAGGGDGGGKGTADMRGDGDVQFILPLGFKGLNGPYFTSWTTYPSTSKLGPLQFTSTENDSDCKYRSF